jgi:SulP family sulfate permease
MLAILVIFSGIVGRVVMPTLAAVLIYAAIGSLRNGAIGTILRTRSRNDL